ncbi:MAG: fibronectin type III domain-containing protein, partial [Acidobacteriota bacterium]
VLGTHSSSPVETQLAQVETVQTLTFTPTIGTVVTTGPAGNVRADDVTYAPAGYNHVYGALAFDAASNNLDMNIAVGAGTLRKPLIIVGNYTAGDPSVVKLAGITLVADTDYFASPRASASQLWITLNRDLTGATNRLEITGGGGLGTPANVVAAATSGSQVTISWTAVAGAASYEVQRSVNIASANGGFATIATPAGTSYNNIGLTADTTYLYRVRAVNGVVMSGFSAIDPATTTIFSDDPLNAGVVIKAAHVTQLRTAVNAMRAAGNLGAQAFTDPVLAAGSAIKAVHMTQLRTALDQARAAIGLAALVYIDPAINAGVTTIKAAHVTGLRTGVK